MMAQLRGDKPLARFHNCSARTVPTRIDGILINTTMASAVQCGEALRDTWIPGHVPIKVLMDMAQPDQRVLKARVLPPIQMESDSEDDLWTAWTSIAAEAIIAMAAPNATQEPKSLTSFPPLPEKGKAFTSVRGRGTDKITHKTTLGPSKSQKNGARITHNLKVVTAALGALTTVLTWPKKSHSSDPSLPRQHPQTCSNAGHEYSKESPLSEKKKKRGA